MNPATNRFPASALALVSPAAFATDFHVAPNRHDANPGTEAKHPNSGTGPGQNADPPRRGCWPSIRRQRPGPGTVHDDADSAMNKPNLIARWLQMLK